jgi:hypothetical protein
MTGFNNRVVNPGQVPFKGYWTVVEDCGLPGQLWRKITWRAQLPTGCEIRAYARASDDRTALLRETFLAITNDTAMADLQGRFIEVRLAMIRGAANQQPALHDLTLQSRSVAFAGEPLYESWVYETENASFVTETVGPEPLTYTWSILHPWSGDFDPMPEEQGTSVTLTNVDLWDDLTLVRLVVTNALGESFDRVQGLSVFPLAFRLPAPAQSSGAGPAERYPATINVRGQPTNGLSRVEVTLNDLRHARVEDLDILLVSPSGAKIILVSDAGASYGVTNTTLVFHPNEEWYPAPPETTALPANQTLHYSTSNYGSPEESQIPQAPTGPYNATLDNLPATDANPNGVWRLYIYDDKSGQTGVLQESWSIHFYY